MFDILKDLVFYHANDGLILSLTLNLIKIVVQVRRITFQILLINTSL